jgi:hypothetical protein
VHDYLTKAGVSFESVAGSSGAVVTRIGDREIRGFDEPALSAALSASGYPADPDPARINYAMALLLLVIMVIYVAMVYGPIAAFLVEMFPAKIRYTSMSLPYHIGNGWFGGMLPLLATAMVAGSGDVYRGLWYPIVIAVMTLIVGAIFLRDPPKDFDIHA